MGSTRSGRGVSAADSAKVRERVRAALAKGKAKAKNKDTVKAIVGTVAAESPPHTKPKKTA